ncbi:hypothetical protein KGY79_05175 [Candidatus Bipolaricaulota bacterium]|nr:hypothetical protein [Candidatus Bipolaricaulota bacterium]
MMEVNERSAILTEEGVEKDNPKKCLTLSEGRAKRSGLIAGAEELLHLN